MGPRNGGPVGEPLEGHDGALTAVAFSRDSGLLAATAGDGTIRVWDVLRPAAACDLVRDSVTRAEADEQAPPGWTDSACRLR